MVCLNCNQECDNKYCSHCGQRSATKRLDVPYMREQIMVSLFQLERGIVYTIKELITRPGHSIREYIQGKRVKHFKPFSFLFVAATVYVLFTKFLGIESHVSAFLDGFYGELNETNNEKQHSLISWIESNQVYITVVSVLFYAIATFIAFSKAGYNFIEHLVLNFYISGIQFIIYTLFAFFIDDESPFVVVPFLVAFIFNAFVYFQFFEDRSWFKRVGGLILTYIIFFILLMMILIAISVFVLDGSDIDW